MAAVGVRTFAQINSSLSALTGVPTTQAAVFSTYQTVQQQLPTVSTLESFSSANQVGIAQLAIQYCNVAVNTPSLAAQLLPGVTLNASTYPGGANSGEQRPGGARARQRIVDPAGGLDRDRRELNSLIGNALRAPPRATPPRAPWR